MSYREFVGVHGMIHLKCAVPGLAQHPMIRNLAKKHKITSTAKKAGTYQWDAKLVKGAQRENLRYGNGPLDLVA